MKKALLPFVTSKNPQHHQALIKNLTEKMNFFLRRKKVMCISSRHYPKEKVWYSNLNWRWLLFFGVTFFSYKKFSWRKPIINLDLHNTQEVWQHWTEWFSSAAPSSKLIPLSFYHLEQCKKVSITVFSSCLNTGITSRFRKAGDKGEKTPSFFRFLYHCRRRSPKGYYIQEKIGFSFNLDWKETWHHKHTQIHTKFVLVLSWCFC